MSELTDKEFMEALGYKVDELLLVNHQHQDELHADPMSDNYHDEAKELAFHNAAVMAVSAVKHSEILDVYIEPKSGRYFEIDDFSPTTNTDDALTLVPDGLTYNIINMRDGVVTCHLYNPDDMHMVSAHREPTLPLAICQAIINLNKEK